MPSARSRNKLRFCGEQEATTDVFFILSGTVRSTSYTAAGREVIYNETEAGEIFGEFSAVDGLPSSSSVVASDEAAASPA